MPRLDSARLGRHRGIVVVLVLASFVAGAAIAAASQQKRGPTPAGVYVGAANLSGATAFARWSGEPLSYVLDFSDRNTWAGISSPWFIPHPWGRARALCAKTKGCTISEEPLQLVMSVPMLPNSGGTIQQGARGRYNAHFRKLARLIARHRLGSRTVIRLGWEFNSGWSRWSAASDPHAYAAFYRQVVRTMRAVAPKLRFDWCPSEGIGQFWGIPGGLAAAYPGDAYVDYIGMDTYDQAWGPNSSVIASPEARWQQIVNEPGGLAWQARFAAAHGKQLTYPEWGITQRADGHGGADNPYFVSQMHAWFASHDVAYQIYFNFNADDGDHSLTSGRFPRAGAMFRRVFGGRA